LTFLAVILQDCKGAYGSSILQPGGQKGAMKVISGYDFHRDNYRGSACTC